MYVIYVVRTYVIHSERHSVTCNFTLVSTGPHTTAISEQFNALLCTTLVTVLHTLKLSHMDVGWRWKEGGEESESYTVVHGENCVHL